MFHKASWLWILCATFVISELFAESDSIPLTKCCKRNATYDILLDYCAESEDDPFEKDKQFPQIFSLKGNKIVAIKVPSEIFHVNYDLTLCPKGSIAKKSFEFQFINDGSLMVEKNKVADPGTFCVDQAVFYSNGSLNWMAYYCIPDPCLVQPCIHKCCPNGMSISGPSEAMLCHSSAVDFYTKLRNEKKIFIDHSVNLISDGRSIPICDIAVGMREPEVNSHDVFQMKSDGRIFVPDLKNGGEHLMNESYCMDYNTTNEGNNESVIL